QVIAADGMAPVLVRANGNSIRRNFGHFHRGISRLETIPYLQISRADGSSASPRALNRIDKHVVTVLKPLFISADSRFNLSVRASRSGDSSGVTVEPLFDRVPKRLSRRRRNVVRSKSVVGDLCHLIRAEAGIAVIDGAKPLLGLRVPFVIANQRSAVVIAAGSSVAIKRTEAAPLTP